MFVAHTVAAGAWIGLRKGSEAFKQCTTIERKSNDSIKKLFETLTKIIKYTTWNNTGNLYY